MVRIIKAKIKDVPRIYNLLKDFAQDGLMLPRSLSELYDVVRSFYVAYPDDQPEVLAGACALHVCWEDLGEIRSLSVVREFQGSGLGGRLIRACESDAREVGLSRLFVLTYIPEYFKLFGFAPVEKSELPHKIWADCLKCIKFPECGEVAMEKKL